jgi:NAD(P)-dependent dehydrogenase (short-subunit alcohol dehydrogenase family)
MGRAMLAAMSAFADSVAIITGAGSGIGRALAVEMAKRGARVTVADINESAAQEVAAAIGERAQARTLDVRSTEGFEALVEEVVEAHGRLDYLFNNAGIGVDGEVHELRPEHWDRVIDVNIRGVINGVSAGYPVMVRQRSGHIINTASMAGLLPVPLIVPYAMTKHAIVGLSRSMRVEAERYGVRVSTLCPSTIETPMLDSGLPEDLPSTSMVNRRRSFLSEFNPPYPAEKVAVETLAGVAANRELIIIPASARRVYLLSRLFPSAVSRTMRKIMNRISPARS